jgi:cytochrome c oxidase subunit IV
MSSIANESSKEAQEMHGGDGHGHGHGAGRYVLVWIALMVGTLITVFTGRMHLPTWGLALALLIATVKGALVALYFMHLAEHQGANRLVFGTSMLFVVLLLMFTLFDMGTRYRPTLPSSSTPSAFPVETLGQSGQYEGMQRAPDMGTEHHEAPSEHH